MKKRFRRHPSGGPRPARLLWASLLICAALLSCAWGLGEEAAGEKTLMAESGRLKLYLSSDLCAIEITDAWLDSEFEGGRHQRRIDMLDEM